MLRYKVIREGGLQAPFEFKSRNEVAALLMWAGILDELDKDHLILKRDADQMIAVNRFEFVSVRWIIESIDEVAV